MKKNKLFLLPLFMLLLAGCKPDASSTPPVSEEPPPSIPSVSQPDEADKTVITVEAARAKAKTDKPYENATIDATITAIFGQASNTKNIIVQEGAFAITLSFVDLETAAEFEVGDRVVASGQVQDYKGLIQLAGATIEASEEAAETITPHVLTEWDAAALAGMDGRWVKAVGLEKTDGVIKTDANSEITLRFPDTEVDIPLYMSNYIDLADKTELQTKINGMGSADTITFEGPVGWYNKPQLNPISAATVTIVEGTATGPVDPLSISLDKQNINMDIDDTEDIKLTVVPVDATYDAVLYTSSNEAVATVAGEGLDAVITAVGKGVATITAAIGDLTATVKVTVRAPIGERINHTVKVKDDITKGAELTAVTFLEQVEGLPEGSEVTNITKVYSVFKGDTNVDRTNELTAVNSLKFASSSVAGELKIELPEDVLVDKVTLKGRAWSSDDASVAINDSEPAVFMKKAADPNEVETYVLELGRASNVLDFTVVKRVFITEMILHQIVGGVELVEGTIEHFLAQDNGFEGELEGVVTNVGPFTTYSMEDETGAVALRISGKDTSKIDFAVGDKISGTFKKAFYKGLIQAEAVDAEYTVTPGPFAAPLRRVDLNSVGLDEGDLLDYQSRIIRGEFEIVEARRDSYDSIYVDLKIGEGEIELKVDNRMPEFASYAFLADLEAGEGKHLILDGATLTWSYDVPLLVIDNPSQAVPVVVGTVFHFVQQADNYQGELVGVITNLGPYNSFSMEDETGAVAIRVSGKTAANINFAVGDKVSATVKKNTFNGLVQAETVGEYVVTSGPFDAPLAKVNLNEVGVKTADLAPYQSRLVSGELEVVSFAKDKYGTYTLTLKLGSDNIVLRVDNRLPAYDTLSFLEDLVADDVVVIDGATITWHNGPQLAIDNAAQVVVQ